MTRTKPGIDWIEVKRRYVAGEPARAIARDLESRGTPLTHVAIIRRAQRRGWRPVTRPGAMPGSQTVTAVPAPKATKGKPDKVSVKAEAPTTPLPATFDVPAPKPPKLQRADGKRTQENLRQVLSDIVQGASLHVAANRAGMSHTTLQNWRRDDEDVERAVLSACAERDQRRELRIEAASETDWNAAKWLLAAQRREVYGGATTPGAAGISVTINIGDPSRPDIVDVTPDPE